jgi:hypothetical protein
MGVEDERRILIGVKKVAPMKFPPCLIFLLDDTIPPVWVLRPFWTVEIG